MRTEIIRNFAPIIGGKSNVLEAIINRFPPHLTFVEVFGGGGVVTLNKSPSRTDIYNDVNDDLINLMEVVRDNPVMFTHMVEMTPYAKGVFDRFREERKAEITDVDPIRRAFIYFYLLKTSINAKCQSFSQPSKDSRAPRAESWRTVSAAISKVAHRLRGITITKLDFKECIERFDSPNTFFYVDPPYYKVYCYEHNLSIERHEELAYLLKKIKGRFLVSINDDPRVREIYSYATIEEITFLYSCIAEPGREENRHVVELMIRNYSQSPNLFDNLPPLPETVEVRVGIDIDDTVPEPIQSADAAEEETK